MTLLTDPESASIVVKVRGCLPFNHLLNTGARVNQKYIQTMRELGVSHCLPIRRVGQVYPGIPESPGSIVGIVEIPIELRDLSHSLGTSNVLEAIRIQVKCYLGPP